MKTYKKILAVIMCVVMTLTAAPLIGFVGLDLPNLFDFKAEAATYSGTCGENLTWTFDINTGVLDITGVGVMSNWSSNSQVPWRIYRSFIKTVKIGNNIATIGRNAFCGSKNLINVTLPYSVTSIGDYAFNGCSSLTDVYYESPQENWNKISIGSYNEILTSAKIHFIDPENPIVESGACGDNLTWTLFESGLFEISGTGAMDNWEYNYVPNTPWKSYLEDIKYVNICDGVTSISDYAFDCCDNLTNVIIPESVTTIGKSAFRGCDSLTSVVIPESVKTIGDYAFCACKALTNIIVDENNQYYSSDSNGVLFNKDKTKLIQYPVGNTRTSYIIPDSVISIGKEVFYSSYNLISITVPDGIIAIGDTAFHGCFNLVSINIPDGVESIGDYAFDSCFCLENIIIPESVKTIGDYAFAVCGMTSIIIPNNVTIIGNSAFYHCGSLVNAIIGRSVTTIGVGAFQYCDSLTSIIVDENNLCYSNDSDGVLFNKNKTELIKYPIGNIRTSYTIPAGVTSIINGSFLGCSNVETISIPNSVTNIGSMAFYGCSSLVDVYYSSTEENWDEISIELYNELLLNATIHYHNHSYKLSVTTTSSCSKEGKNTYICDCGDSYTEIIPQIEHTAGDWETILKPTIEADGKKIKKCKVCGTPVEEQVIEKITEPEFDEALILTPSQSTINYGDSIVLHIDAEIIPEGGYVEWTASNSNFATDISEDGCTYKITPSTSGDTTFTAVVYDEDGRLIFTDEQVMTSKAGFFQKLISFFKNLFGISRIILQSFDY